MKLKLTNSQMEEIEGITPEYPYAYHHVNMEKTTIPWHWHEEVEFGYVVIGKEEISTTGKTYYFQEGEGYFINTNVLATMKNVEKCITDSHLCHSTFLGGHFRSVFETKYINPVLQNRKIELIELRGTTKNQQKILNKLRQASVLQQESDTEFQTRNLFSEIWLLLLEEIRQMDEISSSVSTVNQERLLTMMSYIQENYQEKVSLKHIASSAMISPREALRCFQNGIHETPFEYLIEYRIEIAKKLLKSTKLSITEVAQETGFSSSAYFSKIFKRECNMTPLEYRKQFLQT